MERSAQEPCRAGYECVNGAEIACGAVDKFSEGAAAKCTVVGEGNYTYSPTSDTPLADEMVQVRGVGGGLMYCKTHVVTIEPQLPSTSLPLPGPDDSMV